MAKGSRSAVRLTRLYLSWAPTIGARFFTSATRGLPRARRARRGNATERSVVDLAGAHQQVGVASSVMCLARHLLQQANRFA